MIYGEEKLIKRYDEIIRLIDTASRHPAFKLEMKVLNCVNDMILEPIAHMLSLAEDENCYEIEHLINFSARACSHYKNGRICALDFSPIKAAPTPRTLVVRKEGPTKSGGNISRKDACSLVGTGPKECYSDVLIQRANLDWLNDFCYKFEAGGKCCMAKSSPCHHRVPTGIFENMLKRLNEAERAELIANLGEKLDTAYNLEQVAENILVNLADRNNLSLRYDQIDIFTKNGLETFARERRLNDHYAFLPAFSKEEIKQILTAIQEKNSDPADRYKFYITNLPMASDSVLFCASERNGIVVEYFGALAEHGGATSCWIKQEAIVQTFLDFAKNYVPENLVMGREEAYEFIEYLIATYTN